MSHWVYILTNQRNTTLTIGITNNPYRRLEEHKLGAESSFSRKYNLDKLIYLEEAGDPMSAIDREKQLKKLSRLKKEVLINRQNPDWEEILL